MITSVHTSFLDSTETTDYELSLKTISIEKGWKIQLIVVESENKNILDDLSFDVIGEYLCYRHNEENQLNMKSLLIEQGDVQSIDLSHILKGDKKLK